jgi:hypothetical protein
VDTSEHEDDASSSWYLLCLYPSSSPQPRTTDGGSDRWDRRSRRQHAQTPAPCCRCRRHRAPSALPITMRKPNRNRNQLADDGTRNATATSRVKPSSTCHGRGVGGRARVLQYIYMYVRGSSGQAVWGSFADAASARELWRS